MGINNSNQLQPDVMIFYHEALMEFKKGLAAGGIPIGALLV